MGVNKFTPNTKFDLELNGKKYPAYEMQGYTEKLDRFYVVLFRDEKGHVIAKHKSRYKITAFNGAVKKVKEIKYAT